MTDQTTPAPDLHMALRFATAFVEMWTGNGCTENPPEWPRKPNGDPDPEAIAAYCRAALARPHAQAAESLVVAFAKASAPGASVDWQDIDDAHEWAREELGAERVAQLERETAEALAECEDGVHSWVDQKGRLHPDTRCTHCGEPYGNPK